MKKTLFVLLVGVLLNTAPLWAFATEASLYERLGGEAGVAKFTKQALYQVAHNPSVNHAFEGVNLEKLAKKLTEHTCHITGGGCKYTGDDIKKVHAGLNLTEQDFYALVEALRTALDDNGVGEREKNELLRILAPMKRDVVTH